jgi:hypothetical protein
VRRRPRGELIAAGQAATAPGAGADPARRDDVERLSWAIDRAARLMLRRPTCLVRALALVRLLGADGIDGAVIRVGVRRTRAEGFMAHAWVEWGPHVIGDRPADLLPFSRIEGIDVAFQR